MTGPTRPARNRGPSAVLDRLPVVVADSPVDRAFVAFSLETGGTAIILTRSIPRPNPSPGR